MCERVREEDRECVTEWESVSESERCVWVTCEIEDAAHVGHVHPVHVRPRHVPHSPYEHHQRNALTGRESAY